MTLSELRVRLYRLAVQFVTAIFVLALVPQIAVAGDLCTEGDKLIATGRLDVAADVFARAAAAGEGGCALKGLDEVGRRRGQSATELQRGQQIVATNKDAARLAEARVAILHAIELDSSNSAAVEAFRALLKQEIGASEPFALAVALSRAGHEAEAAVALKEALKTAKADDMPRELEYLAGDPPIWFRDLNRALLPAINAMLVFGQAALWLVGVVAAIVLVFPLIVRLNERRHARFDVEDLVDKGVTTQVGTALSRLIEDEIAALRREGGGASLGLVSAPDAQIALPDVTAATPLAKPLAALLALLPSAIDTLKGELLPAGDAGVGLNVSLVNAKGRVVDATTLWERDYDPAWSPRPKTPEPSKAELVATYYRLALAAASFVLYALTLDIAHRQARTLTDDWRSYALFRVGATWHAVGTAPEVARARKLYVAALAIDPTNRGALFNLGAIDATNADGQAGANPTDLQLARGLERLTLARTHLVSADVSAGLDPYRDRLWYRASYNIAATKFHQYLGMPSPAASTPSQRETTRGEARQKAHELVERAASAVALGDEMLGEGLGLFLRTVEAAGVVLLADIEATA